MEDNEVQQEGPRDNSLENRKKRQMEMLEKAPLGTYWKQVWKEDKGPKGRRTDEYCFITNLEYNNIGGPYLKGERLQVKEGSSYMFDKRATLYDFSFDKSRNAYHEQIEKDEYENLKKKAIKIYENKDRERLKRKTLFSGFNKEFKAHYSYAELMDSVKIRYDIIKEDIDVANKALALCKGSEDEKFIKEIEGIEERFSKFREDNLIRVYSSWDKVEWPNTFRSFSIHEIDVTSLSFEPEKVNENGVGYVGGTPFEKNGKNFTFKVRVYGQSWSVENYSRDYYETDLRVGFNSTGKTWREDDPEGWKTYISKNDKYTDGKYKNNPSWGGDEFYILNDWHFEQLLDLIKHTGLEEVVA
jgi:hypothetical protein